MNDDLARTKWRCRRGLLELDLLLERFVDQHYAELNDAERACFNEILTYSDLKLWDTIKGSEINGNKSLDSLLGLLQKL